MPKTTKPTRKRGHPSSYTDTLAFEICRRIAEGESLRRVCTASDMPDKTTVLRWLAASRYMGAPEGATDRLRDTLSDEEVQTAEALALNWGPEVH